MYLIRKVINLISDRIYAFRWNLLSFICSSTNCIKVLAGEEKQKVFCIGLNKTGTSSWAGAMHQLGYIVGSETTTTKFFLNWQRNEMDDIFFYCQRYGDAFQDLPFSLPNVYKEVDRHFPNAKFVLTVRDSPDQWYNSIVKYHARLWSSDISRAPNITELKSARYWKRGFPAEYIQSVFNTPDNAPYDKQTLVDFYTSYNSEIRDYFIDRSSDFLELNVSDPNALNSLCSFLGHPQPNKPFPWRNKTN